MVKIPQECPLEYVEMYEAYVRPGDEVPAAQELGESVAEIPLIVGKTEVELEERIERAIAWFYENSELQERETAEQ